MVYQEALIDAFKNDTLAAVGLNITTPEPLPLNSELLQIIMVCIIKKIQHVVVANMR